MPSWSNAQPVLAGEYVYACSEPTTVLCLRRSDGRVLWKRTHEYVDLLSPEKRERVQKELVAAERLRKTKLDPLRKKLQEVTRELQGLPGDPFLTKQKGSLKKLVDDLERKLVILDEYKPPRADPLIGLSNCTPVTDGQGVFVLFGNGVGAVYDLEGRRRWARVIRRPKMPFGYSMSPVLAGRALVMSIDKEVLAIDARTGKDLWALSSYRPSAGLAATKVKEAWVVVTAEGSLISAADGRLLARVDRPARAPRCAPMVRKGMLYLLGDRQRLLVEMLLPDRGTGVRLESAATGSAFIGEYYASPVYHDGCVVFWEKKGILSVVSAKDGRRLTARRIGLRGAAYASPTVAGKYLYLGTDDGTIAVLEPTITPAADGKLTIDLREVARNRLDTTRSSPVFDGNRMFLRTHKSLYCIGAKAGTDPAPADDDNPFRLGGTARP